MNRKPLSFRSFVLRVDGNSAPEYAIVAGFILMIAIALGPVIKQTVLPSVHALTGVLETDQPTGHPAADGVMPSSKIKSHDLTWLTSASLAVAFSLAVYGLVSILRRRKQGKQMEEPLDEQAINRFAVNRKRILAKLRKHRVETTNWIARAEHVMDGSFAHVKLSANRQLVESSLDESVIGVVIVTSDVGALAGAIDSEQLELATADSAANIMYDVRVSVEASTHLSSVLEVMHANRLTWVPVTSDGAVCGVLSIDDVLATLLCTLQMISEIDHEYRVILNRSLGMSETTT